MSEQKLTEFRERAQSGVAGPDPDLLLQRGRNLRRRRQLVPVAALAACAAIGIALLAPGGGDTRTDVPPARQPSVTETPDPAFLGTGARLRDPGTYGMDQDEDGRRDGAVELFGDGWETWESGGFMNDTTGVVSWGFRKYQDTPIPSCNPVRPATSLSGATSQLTHAQVTVTRAARPTTKLGLTGTYLQLSRPDDLGCPNGAVAGGLMTDWPGAGKPTTTVDVWLLEDGDRLLILTRGVHGHPSPATLENLDRTLRTLQYFPPD